MTDKHTEATIIKELRRRFQNGYNYRIDNAFIFGYDWESDFFCINRDGWAFEFEVKTSRSDFKADMKKPKHEIFKTGYYTQTHRSNGVDVSKQIEKKFIPNRFYYAVPCGLISKDEIPEYAGLITIDNLSLKIVRRAPFIHRRKLEFRKVLCDKFYNRWIEERRKNNLMQYDIKQMEKKIERLERGIEVIGNIYENPELL